MTTKTTNAQGQRLGVQITAESAVAYTDGRTPEEYVLKALQEATDLRADSDELMGAVKNWPSYYHLGVGRTVILRCLDLPPEARVLEIGAGCGAITRYLGEHFASVDAIEGSPDRARIARERCRDLDNVTVITADLSYVELEPVYDLVVVVGVLEYAPVMFAERDDPRSACLAFLKRAASGLNPEGQLVLAIENKIGEKYWSGCVEDHTGALYEGIHGYPTRGTPVTFSKRELADLLTEAGLTKSLFHFCFPEYHFATTILSEVGDEADLYLHNWVDYPFKSLSRMRKYLFHEGLASRTLSNAGLLREFANSFLVVAGRAEASLPQPRWAAKKFNMRRPLALRSVTSLVVEAGDIRVEKEPLDGNRVTITQVPGLSLKQEVADAGWAPGDLLDFELYQASLGDDFEQVARSLFVRYHEELVKQWGTGRADEGGFPLLQPGAHDCVFSNIVNKDGEWRFVDEEWYWDREIPVDFVLYRCIRFCLHEHGVSESAGIELISSLYPAYGGTRHKANRELAEAIQEATVGGMNPKLILSGLQRVSGNKVVWDLLSRAWLRTPHPVRAFIRNRL
jgi:2-polyprenyl-3-methyl-5-hydroxy-6-metoxy-1,4-benzoquinol methylase